MLFVHAKDEERLKDVEKMYQETRRLICQCKPCALKFEVWCSFAVFLECYALAKTDAAAKTETMRDAKKYAFEAAAMLKKEGMIKSRQNIKKDIDAIIDGEPSATAKKIFGREDLKGRYPRSESHLISLEGTELEMFRST